MRKRKHYRPWERNSVLGVVREVRWRRRRDKRKETEEEQVGRDVQSTEDERVRRR